MKDLEYTLEMADGTVVKVGLIEGTAHPDIKAFQFPAGALVPFSHQNLPTARDHRENSEYRRFSRA
ncbi:hypothetical protein [Roseiconus lacunae]|uniref:Uncharacterized protein n=1 Tax=Roseiconus lacunae TaxID=2605694 RepID=A0ABT7PI34_9BACT|nr:hypothetical protein [Roseiconus lacunae]MCD0461337.1 hypothetical protein [Roseiconus lacunae]MDM4016164.1 hypothetical protein [Roseiconus lacunae]WRQ51502.1 hypothetical protein U8335_02955 [Stieleria sp. HD01]